MQRAPILPALALLSTLAANPDAAVAQQPAAMVSATADVATAPPGSDAAASYQIQPGDVLTVTVWKETDLTGEVLVRPDFGISFPLVGELDVRGKTVDALREIIAERLKHYIPDPVVTVSVKALNGNHVYVVGKVEHPGEFPFVREVDVMQALALGGGTTPFAELNDIVILRRENGVQQAIRFRYADVARGKNLSQDIVLKTGDTVVVP